MSGLENLMDNFSLSNSTSMKGKSMNAMKGGATTTTPMSSAKTSKAEADLLDDTAAATVAGFARYRCRSGRWSNDTVLLTGSVCLMVVTHCQQR